jgi:hypothetical protein
MLRLPYLPSVQLGLAKDLALSGATPGVLAALGTAAPGATAADGDGHR